MTMKPFNPKTTAPLLVVLLALGGCGQNPVIEDQGAIDSVTENTAAPNLNETADTIADNTQSAEVANLWQQAEQKRTAGDVAGAAADVQQALQFSPNSPVLLSRLAELRLALGQYVSAEDLAAQSNQLAAGRNSLLAYRNWLLIAKARSANNDPQGSKQALERALSYR